MVARFLLKYKNFLNEKNWTLKCLLFVRTISMTFTVFDCGVKLKSAVTGTGVAAVGVVASLAAM